MKKQNGNWIVTMTELIAENERLRQEIQRQQEIIRKLNIKLDRLEGKVTPWND